MKFDVSAPGKTILHGEHAVVYGKAAIAMSLNLRTRLTLVSPMDEKVILELKNLGITKEWDVNELNKYSISCSELGGGEIVPADEECVKAIINNFIGNDHSENESERLSLAAFLYLWIHVSKSYNIGTFPSCHIVIESDLSIGSGMGSSASYSVCLSAAILMLCGRITPSLLSEDKHLINKWAFQSERIFHGKPSGMDNSVCTFGGAILYENGISDMLSEVQNVRILLVDTKVSRNTKHLVSVLKEKRELYPSIIDSVLEAINSVSINSWKVLKLLNNTMNENKQTESLQEFILMNHHLLNCLGVGHEKLNQIFNISQKYSYPSKLTGAGGGGCAIVLIPQDKDEETSINQLKAELESCDFKVWDLLLGYTGVQVKFDTT